MIFQNQHKRQCWQDGILDWNFKMIAEYSFQAEEAGAKSDKTDSPKSGSTDSPGYIRVKDTLLVGSDQKKKLQTRDST